MSEYQSVGHEAVWIVLAEQWLTSRYWQQTPFELCWPELIAKAVAQTGNDDLASSAQTRLVDAGLTTYEVFFDRFIFVYLQLTGVEA